MSKTIQDKFDEARDMASDKARRAAEGIRHGAETAGDKAKAAGAVAGEKLEKVKERANKAAGDATRIITEHPMAAAAAAVVVGAAIAGLMAKGRKKDDALSKIVNNSKANDTLKTVMDRAEQMLEKLTDAARTLPETARSTAHSGMESAQAGLKQARTMAGEAAEKVDLQERAGKLLSLAGAAATHLASRFHEKAQAAQEQAEQTATDITEAAKDKTSES